MNEVEVQKIRDWFHNPDICNITPQVLERVDALLASHDALAARVQELERENTALAKTVLDFQRERDAFKALAESNARSIEIKGQQLAEAQGTVARLREALHIYEHELNWREKIILGERSRYEWVGPPNNCHPNTWAAEALREQITRLEQQYAHELAEVNRQKSLDLSAECDRLRQHIASLQARLTASEAENFKLAAGQCVVDGGLVGGEGGGAYCTLKAKRKWTRERPTVAGWYWFKDDCAPLGSEAATEKIYRLVQGTFDKMGQCELWVQGTTWVRVRDMIGSWQGPLAPGEE